MPVKIRLQRHGKKGKPFYWVVAADVRAKRDGRYLEKIGIYNPNTNPATVEIDIDSAVSWLEKGAQPTDTARTLLSYRGALLKHHLNGGIQKGALTQEEADKKLAAWLEEKEAKIISKGKALAKAKRLEDEKATSEKRLEQAAAAEIAEVEVSEVQEGENVSVEAPENASEEAAIADVVAETQGSTEENTEEAASEEKEG
jgi:small subunit ribosomal protein S16